MKFRPRPYQSKIIDWIADHPRCAVWAGMGMGKTVAVLTVLDACRTLGEGPALIIAPLRVARSTWPDEINKWDHLNLRVSVICGDAKRRRQAIATPADIYCTNYENLPWLVATVKTWPWETVVVDESTRLKGFRLRNGSRRAAALAKVQKYVRRFIELTGTPAPNGLIDLWGQAWFLDKGQRLGCSIRVYEERYFYPVKTGNEAYMVKWIPMPEADDRIKHKLSDIAITVNPEDYFDITQPIYNDIEVILPADVMDQYDKLEKELFLSLADGEQIEAVNAQSLLGKCLQFASGAVYVNDRHEYSVIHSAKIDALRSVIEEAAGAPVLVSYQFRHEIDRIQEAFPQARLLDANPQTIREWNAGEIPILLAHPAACGHGLNLQDGGNILCFYSVGWNYEHYAQIIERIGPTRQAQSGHPRPVYIHVITAKDTVDVSVARALMRKESVLNHILGKKKK